MSSDRRVLSVSSHVVYGYVGNKALVFPFQLHGFDVDVINTCQLSNHLAYPKGGAGQRMSGGDLLETARGMELNGLLAQNYAITGYIGNVSLLEAIVEIVDKLRAQNPSAVYVADPVLGDAGRLYVPEAVVPAVRAQILRRANIITPNHFEAGLLAERPLNSMADLPGVLDQLHALGPQTVIITSLDSGFPAPWLSDDGKEQLTLIASDRRGPVPDLFRVVVPRMWREKTDEGETLALFSGTGDLFVSLLVASLPQYSLREACCRATAGVLAVLRRTVADRSFELRLVQSRDELLSPPSVPEAVTLTT